MQKITIRAGNVVIPAILNDTVAAKDFEKRMPFVVSGNDSGIDYCCVAKEGQCLDSERQAGWKNGDISLAGGWFAILYAGQETSQSYKDMMIIGHIDSADLHLLDQLPRHVEFLVEKASEA